MHWEGIGIYIYIYIYIQALQALGVPWAVSGNGNLPSVTRDRSEHRDQLLVGDGKMQYVRLLFSIQLRRTLHSSLPSLSQEASCYRNSPSSTS
ncbi:hypothetical protein VTK26DRAFT_5777 [Humicola hyalothermophila]